MALSPATFCTQTRKDSEVVSPIFRWIHVLQIGVRYSCPYETMTSAAVFPWIPDVASPKGVGICWFSSEAPSARHLHSLCHSEEM